MYIKKTILFFILLISFARNTVAQCAMCKAVVEGGEQNMAEGVNSGITYLMIFPYILVGILAYFLFNNRKKQKI